MSGIRLFIFGFALAANLFGFSGYAQSAEPVIVGYVFPQNGPLQAGQVDAHGMTRINYAFATIKNGRMVLAGESDGANLAQLIDLRKQNPSLAILVSVGGWLGSGSFSDVALNAQSRSVFVDSAIEVLKNYDLDGVDVDWEYPGLVGAGNHFRREDKQNFTLLLKDLRARLTQESQATHRRLYLTIAAGASDEYVANTEMAQVAQYVDTVNLMAYDYYEPGSDPTTGNHAALFTDPADPQQESADNTVKAFKPQAFPRTKLFSECHSTVTCGARFQT